MTDMKELTGRDYLSYSALSSYADCSERFLLERVMGVRQEQGWWLPAGTALHLATEMLDRGEVLTAELAWSEAWRTTLARLDEMPTKAGGRASKEFPNKEDKSYWDAKGVGFVADYLLWRDLKLANGWQWLDINGVPAVELAVEGTFGDTAVKGYIDRVIVSPDGEVYIIDLKSSQREPLTIQMDVYRHLLWQTHQVNASFSQYYLFRKGSTSEAKPLRVSEQWISHYFNTARKGIEAGVFLPNVGMLCGTCGVRSHCSVFGSPDLQDITLDDPAPSQPSTVN